MALGGPSVWHACSKGLRGDGGRAYSEREVARDRSASPLSLSCKWLVLNLPLVNFMGKKWPMTCTVLLHHALEFVAFSVLSTVTHITGTCVACIFTWDKAVLLLWWVFEEAVNSSCLHFVFFRWLPLVKARAHLTLRKCSQLTVNSICVWCKANCKETASHLSCILGVSELAD